MPIEIHLQFGIKKERSNDLMRLLKCIWNEYKNLSDTIYEIEKSQIPIIEKMYMTYQLAKTPKDSISKMNW